MWVRSLGGVRIDAAARAEIVDQANERFAQMLEELAAQRPEGEEGEVVDAWLADWHTYLDDRVAFAEALREDPEARLLVRHETASR